MRWDQGPAGRDIVQQSINKSELMLWQSESTGAKKTSGKPDLFAYVGITPAGMSQWLAINHPSLWPTTYGQLRELGLGLAICEWLEFGVGQDRAQEMVIRAFFDVLREFNLDARGGLRQAGRSLKNAIYPQPKVEVASDLHGAIRMGLKGVKAKDWPQGVLEFPASEIA